MDLLGWLLRFVYKKMLHRLRVPRDVLRFAWKRYADRVALISPAGRLTYGELRARVLQLTGQLQALGAQKGDVCFVMLAHGADQVVANLAAMECGVVLSGAPRHGGEAVLQQALQLLQPKVMLYDPQFHAFALTVQRMAPGIRLLDLGALARYAGPLQPSAVPIEPEDLLNIGFTSGTTGIPKALAARHGTSLLSLKLVLENVEIKKPATPDIALIGIPVAGAGSGLVMPTLLSGGAMLIPAAYRSAEFLDLIPRYGVTRLFTTPSLLIDMIDDPALGRADLRTLRNIIYGTELMPAAKLEEALRLFGPILQQGYGSAEVLPPVTMLQPHDHVIDGVLAPREILSSVGRVVPGVQVVVADDDDHPLEAGRIGQLLIRSPTMFGGYLQQTALNDEVLRGGWLHIGDVGYFDRSGFLHVLGRKQDVIRRHGHVTYPRLVEEVMHDHPAIKETAYVQVGDMAVMAVSLRLASRPRLTDETLPQELHTWLAPRVPSVDLPDRFVVMEELPRSALAKVLRREVRQILSQSLDHPEVA